MRDRSENELASLLGGRVTNASGAVNDDSDIRLGEFLVECKRRETAKSISFDPKIWEKLRKQCAKANKLPLFIFQNNARSYCITFMDIVTMRQAVSNKSTIYSKVIPTKVSTKINIHYDDFWEIYIDAHSRNAIALGEFEYKNNGFTHKMAMMEVKDLKTLLDGKGN